MWLLSYWLTMEPKLLSPELSGSFQHNNGWAITSVKCAHFWFKHSCSVLTCIPGMDTDTSHTVGWWDNGVLAHPNNIITKLRKRLACYITVLHLPLSLGISWLCKFNNKTALTFMCDQVNNTEKHLDTRWTDCKESPTMANTENQNRPASSE